MSPDERRTFWSTTVSRSARESWKDLSSQSTSCSERRWSARRETMSLRVFCSSRRCSCCCFSLSRRAWAVCSFCCCRLLNRPLRSQGSASALSIIFTSSELRSRNCSPLGDRIGWRETWLDRAIGSLSLSIGWTSEPIEEATEAETEVEGVYLEFCELDRLITKLHSQSKGDGRLRWSSSSSSVSIILIAPSMNTCFQQISAIQRTCAFVPVLRFLCVCRVIGMVHPRRNRCSSTERVVNMLLHHACQTYLVLSRSASWVLFT